MPTYLRPPLAGSLSRPAGRQVRSRCADRCRRTQPPAIRHVPRPNQSRAGRQLARPKADKPRVQGSNFLVKGKTTPELFKHFSWLATKTFNDPSAGSPTETLLRLLLPLNDKVRTASRGVAAGEPAAAPQSGGLTGSFNR